jgi:hypothetical protein
VLHVAGLHLLLEEARQERWHDVGDGRRESYKLQARTKRHAPLVMDRNASASIAIMAVLLGELFEGYGPGWPHRWHKQRQCCGGHEEERSRAPPPPRPARGDVAALPQTAAAAPPTGR